MKYKLTVSFPLKFTHSYAAAWGPETVKIGNKIKLKGVDVVHDKKESHVTVDVKINEYSSNKISQLVNHEAKIVLIALGDCAFFTDRARKTFSDYAAGITVHEDGNGFSAADMKVRVHAVLVKTARKVAEREPIVVRMSETDGRLELDQVYVTQFLLTRGSLDQFKIKSGQDLMQFFAGVVGKLSDVRIVSNEPHVKWRPRDIKLHGVFMSMDKAALVKNMNDIVDALHPLWAPAYVGVTTAAKKLIAYGAESALLDHVGGANIGVSFASVKMPKLVITR